MGSVTDICKYHFLSFVTIIHVKVISGHQVGKKGQTQKKSGFRVAIYVFRSDFRKESENDPKTLFEASKLVENKIRKIMSHVLHKLVALLARSVSIVTGRQPIEQLKGMASYADALWTLTSLIARVFLR